MFRHLVFVALLSAVLAACSSSSNTPVCSYADPAVLAASSWPKFRHDRANTGSIDVALSPEPSTEPLWVFPAKPASVGAFQASPVLNTDDALIYIGSGDGTMYVLQTGAVSNEDRLAASFTVDAQFGISSTALVGLRDGKDAIFVTAGDGRLVGVDGMGFLQAGSWPFPGFAGPGGTSPNISVGNGVIYGGSLLSVFYAVCPNGIESFILSTAGVASSPAVGPDGNVYFGADDGQLRAVGVAGTVLWGFSASAPILTAPVVEVDASGKTAAIYVADAAGRVFKVNASGQPDRTFAFPQRATPAAGPTPTPTPGLENAMQSSPALAGDHLYFGYPDGRLYAIEKDTGDTIWTVQTGGEITSSPAVATLGPTVVVVGSTDGNVYFVEDDGTPAPPYQTVTIGAPIHTSPAIDKSGTVYLGADDGRVYAIDAAPPAP